MRIGKATKKAYDYACKHFHYARTTPIVGDAFNVFNDENEWCGVIIYGPGANNHIASPFGKWQGQALELVRVALNGKQGHGNTSKAVALTLKQIKRARPLCELIVSYADIDQEHIGTLYQATNWIYVGDMNENTLGAFIVNGKKMHPKSVHSKGWIQSLEWLKENIDPNAKPFITKGKRKYLYPLTKEMRKKITPLALPYPCGNSLTEKQPSALTEDGGAIPTLPLQI